MTTPAAPVAPAPAPAPTPTPAPSPSPTASPTSAPPAAPAPAASPFAGLSDAEKDRLLTFYMGATRAQEARITELAGKVETLVTRPAAPTAPVPDAAELNKGFYEKPYETTREIVRREIKEAIEPLTGFVHAFSSNSELEVIKKEFKADPRLAQVFELGEPSIDHLVNQAVSKGVKLSRELVMGAIANVKGGIELGWIGTGSAPAAPSAPSAPRPGEPIIPPHLRPSAPPAPGPLDTKPKLRDLTEEEKRLARENKMSDEQYLRALDMPASAVTDPKAWETPK